MPRASKRSKAPPEPSLVSLEEFLVSCQKSLARAVKNAEQTGKSASEFATGQQALYVIDGLEIDLSTGIATPNAADVDERDRVLLDLDAPAESRSHIRFRVESRPMETASGARLEIAMLSPPGDHSDRTRFRVWLADDAGAPVPDYPVSLFFARAGSKREKLRKPIEAHTDVVGRIDFYVDLDDHFVKIIGDRRRHKAFLEGDGGEFFVWAMAERAPDWAVVSEPAPPKPPIPVARMADGTAAVLCTQVVQVKIGEGRQP